MLSQDLSNSLIVHQDEYVLPKDLLPKIKDQIDWERPETIDWLRIKKTIEEARSSHDFIIIEGIFSLSDSGILSAADYTISLHIDKSTFIERRKKETRWGNEPEWFMEHVWTSHLKFCNPHKARPDIIIEDSSTSKYKFILNQIRLL